MPTVTAYNWDSIPATEVRPGVTQRAFRGDDSLVTYNTLAPGMEPRPHSHPFDQVFMLISGRVILHIGDETIPCGPGTVVQIPRDVLHWAEAPRPEDGVAINIDVFSPVREDYLPLVAYQREG